MKALELIKQIKNVDENPYHKTRTIIFNRDDMAFIKEAIAELEALQQRSCNGCKHGEIDKFEQYRVTCKNKLALLNHMVNADFCCNRYEAKEQ